MDKFDESNLQWSRGVRVEDNQEWTTNITGGSLSLSLRDGVITQTRPDPGTGETLTRTIILESVQKRGHLTLDFLPLYPDRPIVFKIEDTLSIPPGQNGFFCLTFYLEVGVRLLKSDTLVERILPAPRKQTLWGPPQNGLMAYQERSPLYTDPIEVMESTSTATAILPVYYQNRREEEETVDRCLVPLDELDLYRNERDDLIFEVVRLRQLEEFYQEPQPLKRPPREMRQAVTHFLKGPVEAKSLLEQVKSLPRLNNLTSLFLNR